MDASDHYASVSSAVCAIASRHAISCFYLRPRKEAVTALTDAADALRLSLVTCPVVIYPASSQAEKIHFDQINRKTGTACASRWSMKGKYVEVDPEELDAVEVEATHIIDIDTRKSTAATSTSPITLLQVARLEPTP